MSRKLLRLVPIMLIVVVVLGALPATTSARQATTVTWFIGLGTGGQPAQLEAEQKVVDDFNASQDAIKLEIIVAENSVAPDTLSTLIASGQAPDIVGPVGGDGANRFYGSWLDLQPLVESSGYDLSQFPEATVDFYRKADEGLVGLPFASFPSFVYYRPALFDEAGLPYPPAAYGEVYGAGTEYEGEWNMDKVAEIAKYLTVDANGNDASMEEFDPENIIQWGFDFQWPNPRQIPTLFGAVTIFDGENVTIPESWRAAWDWYYKGMWTDHFYPNASQIGSDLLAAGNPFSSGNMAMAVSHSWYTCCLEDTEWQAAANPSYNGVVTARLHADTFRIMKDTKNPEAAFEVLSYLVGKSAEDTGASDALFLVYGAMPTRANQLETYLVALNEKYTQGVNWDVVLDSLNYIDIPSHEAYIPNFNKVEDLLQSFQTKLDSTPGLDVNAELDQLQADLQAAVDEVQ